MARASDFDRDEVILKAMEVFWEKGFHGTSMSDLMEATDLHKGSLYNAFESKENLFLLALEKYGDVSKSNFYKDECPMLYLKKFFQRLVKQGSTDKNYKGCLVMNTCLEFGQDKSKAQKLSKVLYERVGDNFLHTLTIAQEREKLEKKANLNDLRERLLVAAFSIREISKFQKDKVILKNIANNALEPLGIRV
ncbi:hypothetical protein BIY24_04080 [Halobacteriovorax marinus]|uniref:TetR/AcrR family transcriptional regulator n=1 Tax=Halobacteriovorax marinus TaxID=97084 RepID=UPI000BC2DC73|nr:TetR/AcrR family transcriptional regulator [Halobacteriovorax marinus]ATH07143.1 hypothetical protein BIY24_04080 [Halobacteriovorax marinus]